MVLLQGSFLWGPVVPAQDVSWLIFPVQRRRGQECMWTWLLHLLHHSTSSHVGLSFPRRKDSDALVLCVQGEGGLNWTCVVQCRDMKQKYESTEQWKSSSVICVAWAHTTSILIALKRSSPLEDWHLASSRDIYAFAWLELPDIREQFFQQR